MHGSLRARIMEAWPLSGSSLHVQVGLAAWGTPRGEGSRGSLRSLPCSQQGERQAVGLQDSPRVIKYCKGPSVKDRWGN